LFHGAHTLPQGTTATGVGFSGTFTAGEARDIMTEVRSRETQTSRSRDIVAQESALALALAPQVAPFVGMRLGLANDNEIGISYTGRAIRGDARHVFHSGPWALSLGAGLGGYLARTNRVIDPQTGLRPETNPEASSLGADVPILFGWRSDAGVVSLWCGARGGYERITGNLAESPTAIALALHHWRVGGVAGLRLGFRHIHAALELETAYHGVSGEIGDTNMKLNGVTLTPGGGLLLTF
jgi:hypothetical protein